MNLFDQIHKFLEELTENNIPFLVEGKKDEKALRELGVENIVVLNCPLFEVVEKLSCSEVVLLTDFDKEGKKLYSKLYQECQHKGIKVNNRLRHFLLRETEVTHVEGLVTYLRNKEQKRSSLFSQGKRF